MNLTNEKIIKKKRKYINENFNAENWEEVKKCLLNFINENISTVSELETYIIKTSELKIILSETMAWKYIKMTCNADKSKFAQIFNDFYANIVAQTDPFFNSINKKIYENDNFKSLDSNRFGQYIKILKNEIEMFCEKNIPLMIKEQELSNKYGEISSKIIVTFNEKEYTLIQMRKFLKEKDRTLREKAWKKTNESLLKEKEDLNDLFDDLKKVRVKISQNAGFDNYRDYMHQLKARFDYTPNDLFEFHKSVEKIVVPIVKELNNTKKEKLGFESLRPWDNDITPDYKTLKPFKNSEELINKTISILSKIKDEFGIKFNKMKNTELLDLENRKGKAPGGYNYPLEETGAAFIFMNSIGLQSDVTTLLHESGHAMHSFATANEDIQQYKETPSEVAELASMAMELISMEYWDEFYPDEKDLKKAKIEQLTRSIEVLPWVMTVDAFQHWLYTNPNKTVKERTDYFSSLMDRFGSDIDYSGLEEEKSNSWLKQLHIFEVPFYYIEYAISQLGAIAIYKNYKENKQDSVDKYEKFLNLGYSKSIKDIYEEAGIKFDFSEKYIKELINFIKNEIYSLI